MSEYKDPESYLPHRKPMVVLDKVIKVDSDSAVCESYVSAEGVLGSFIEEDGTLPAVFSLELISQALGVWSGYTAQQNHLSEAPLGMIMSVRNLNCAKQKFAKDSVLTTKIRVLMNDGVIGSCEGSVFEGEELVCSGVVNAYQPTEEQLSKLFTR